MCADSLKESNSGRKKLYRVFLKGMIYNSTGVNYGISYVVAQNTDEAYRKVKDFLDTNEIGYFRDRELDKVELIADTYRYTNTNHLLFL